MKEWDAVETAERIRRGDVSRREVLEAAIERAKAARPLGAIVTETFERARTEIDRASGPLAGVPTFIKDLTHVTGVPIGWGTAAVEGAVSTRTDPTVRHLVALGLVSLGKSATPELGMTGTTEPLGRAPTRNPWDPTRSSGGSSGGAASLVASGVVPIAHASDGGGSIRIPAASCGLVGLKPTRGRFDIEASRLLPINVGVHGVVTRTVRDTIAFWSALDSHLRPRRPLDEVRRPTGTLRIGHFTRSPIGRAVDPSHTKAVEETARVLAGMGHSVEAIDCPFPSEIIHDFVRYWALLAWVQDRGGRALVHPRFDRSRLEPWTKGLSRWCEREPRALASSLRRLRRFAASHTASRRAHDVLLCPVLGHPPPTLGHLATDVPFEDALSRILDHFPFTGILNATGEPALSLPASRTATGLPIGVQLIGHMHDEATLLGLALALEEAMPWPRVAPCA
ncbi:MAG: amidase [Deltaproteobacteria bacterium]|nr:amidase [Deltaproteobacteria bacterium]